MAISCVLGSLDKDAFDCIPLMPQPVEPDKLIIQDYYNIYEIRAGKNSKEKTKQATTMANGASIKPLLRQPSRIDMGKPITERKETDQHCNLGARRKNKPVSNIE